MFTPHKFTKTIKVSHPVPTVQFTLECLGKMRKFVDICEDEIGWFCIVERVFDDKENAVGFLVSDAFLVEQKVHGATTEISPEGQIKIYEKAVGEFGEAEAMNYINKIRGWGHSHVRMGTGPSSQDDTQMEEFNENGADWFIRIICNKHGECRVDVFEYDYGIIYLDIPWTVNYSLDSSITEKIEADYKELVSKISYAFKSPVSTFNGKVNYPGSTVQRMVYDPTERKMVPINGEIDDSTFEYEGGWYGEDYAPDHKEEKKSPNGNVMDGIRGLESPCLPKDAYYTIEAACRKGKKPTYEIAI